MSSAPNSWSGSTALRVAFDISSTRGRKTGIGVYTAQLLDALHEFAPHIETIALQDDATVEQRTDTRILREQITLPRLAQSARADLLHLTGFAAPLRSRVPVMLTVMDLIGSLFSKNFPPVSRFYWSRYLPYTLRAARHIITLSENTKRDVLKLAGVPAERITVIPPGYDLRYRVLDDSQLLQTTAARLQLPAAYFLYVGTLEPRKGIDTLISAFAEIAARVPEHLVLVGKRGWYFETLFAQVRALHLESRIHFLDYISDDDLPIVYNLAKAFVLPSRYEGFGLPPLEAMACGIPVIVTGNSSLPEVVGTAGVIFPADAIHRLGEAMLAAATDLSLHNEMRANGLSRAQEFSWQRAATATAALYLKLSTLQSPISHS